MAKQSKKKQSPGQKAAFLAYATQGRAQKNKAARLARHVRNHPNDAQAAKAVASGHTRTPSKGNLVKPFFGWKITGEKSVTNARTGKKFKVPTFSVILPRLKAGAIPNAVAKAKPAFFNRVEQRVGISAFELKAALGL